MTARVSNLKTLNPDISHDSLTAAVIESFCDFYGYCCSGVVLVCCIVCARVRGLWATA